MSYVRSRKVRVRRTGLGQLTRLTTPTLTTTTKLPTTTVLAPTTVVPIAPTTSTYVAPTTATAPLQLTPLQLAPLVPIVKTVIPTVISTPIKGDTMARLPGSEPPPTRMLPVYTGPFYMGPVAAPKAVPVTPVSTPQVPSPGVMTAPPPSSYTGGGGGGYRSPTPRSAMDKSDLLEEPEVAPPDTPAPTLPKVTKISPLWLIGGGVLLYLLLRK